MVRKFYALAFFALLVLLSSSGCASSHQHQQTDAGYTSYGDTGGGWQTVQSLTAP